MLKFKTLTRLISKSQFLPFSSVNPLQASTPFFLPLQKSWFSNNKFNYRQSSQVLEVEHYIAKANEHNQANKINEALESYDKALSALTSALNCEVPTYKDTLTMANIHIKKGSIFYLSENLEDALVSFNKAKDYLKDCPGAELLIGECYDNIGSIHMELKEYDNAVINLQKAIQIFIEKANDLGLAKAYHGISIAYGKLDLGDLSLENVKKCLEIRIKINGEQHEDVANNYLVLGEALMNQENYHQALAAFKMAFDIKVKLLGINHLEISEVYSNIAQTYSLLGSGGEALANYIKSLKIKEMNLGKDISLTGDYVNIGDLYCNGDNHVKALDYYKTALKINNKAKSAKNSHYILYQLGSIFLKLGETNAAIKRFEEGVQARKKISAVEEGPGILDFYEMLGLAYFNQQKYNQAEQYYSEALRISQKDRGELSYDTIQLYSSLASTNCFAKNYEDAMENYQRALEGQIANLGDSDYRLGYTYHGIGHVYYMQKKLDKAVEFYQKAIDMLVLELADDNYYFSDLHNDLGLIMKEQGKIPEAIENLKQAMNIVIQNYGAGHTEVKRLKNELKKLYDKQGDFEQVNKLERFLGF